ncbi:MAG TPA: tRNA uracil 4-sulfurtransferase ThiI [Longimicrobiaceae bacterium]|nr:tRNA uracil 4-sulfurtransferase ThiI [Longimicrobiaceae bacterium]
MASDQTLALVRLSSELSTKARGTRRRFMRRLVQNARDALATTGADFHVESQWTRLYVRSTGGQESLDVLRRVPGISSYSVVLGRCRADLDEILRTGTELFAAAVHGRTYAVRVRRTGSHPFSSSDVMYRLGAALNPGATVDLTDPEVEVEVEVRDQEVYFFSGRVDGLGGLPLAVEGRAVCLLSGGFDSAVAAWMMLKRGVRLDYVFCNLAGEAYERSVAQVAKVLADQWSYGTDPRLHVVDFGPVLDEIRAKSQPKYWQLVLKRLMYRTADRIAKELRAQATVTGEAIGQVSSQTLSNLAAIDRSSRIPVFRPLIGFDKMDIVDLSRRIGTFDISSKVKEYCAIAPGNPATSAKPRETEEQEARLDPAVLRRAIESRKVLDIRRLRAADLILSYLFTETVPEDAVVIDLRTEPDWEVWHYPGATNRPSWEISANPKVLDKERKYVLYCDQGIQSAQVAERMQREGYEAYAFRGGTAALKRQVEG